VIGAWHHVAGVFDGTEVLIYVNSALSGRTAVLGEFAPNMGGPLVFGSGCGLATAEQCADAKHSCFDAPGCGGYSGPAAGIFAGDLDEALVYATAISQGAIKQHFR